MGNPDELQKAIEAGIPSVYGWTRKAVGASITAHTVVSGLLHSIFVGSHSCPSLTIYDNASGASTTAIFSIDKDFPVGNYVVDYKVATGITTYAAVGNLPNVILMMK
jgi:hypothetical protein